MARFYGGQGLGSVARLYGGQGLESVERLCGGHQKLGCDFISRDVVIRYR